MIHEKGLRRVTPESLDRMKKNLKPGPMVFIEHLWDVRKNGRKVRELDANGDSADGYVINFHAVSVLGLIFWWTRVYRVESKGVRAPHTSVGLKFGSVFVSL